MTRFPEKGKIKTRLADRIGDDTTLEIYLAVLQDTMSAVDAAISDTILSVYGYDIGSTDLDGPFRDKNRFFQKGGNLGERQFNSLTEAYNLGYKKAIVIAGDCPEISTAGIIQAFSNMDESDAVIGPCFDGGYYLLGIGYSKLELEIFQDIDWGKETVLRQLRKNLEHLKLANLELDPLHDIDTIEDLASFMERDAVLDAPITHRVISKLLEKGELEFE
jgi:rSAM/selenodomain-associated transferase 1